MADVSGSIFIEVFLFLFSHSKASNILIIANSVCVCENFDWALWLSQTSGFYLEV